MKKIWLLAVLLAVVSALAACGAGAASSAGADDDNDISPSVDDDDDNDDNDASPADDDDNDASPADDDSSAPPPMFDADGRQIMLRGCNYMGMEFGWFGQTQDDFDRMAAWGFNIVRLPIAWSFLEPEQGVWDDTYLSEKVAPVVGYAANAGLHIIIDMHQYEWSPAFGGDGLPSWTCEEFANLPAPFNELFASGDFWDHPDFLDDWVEAWNRVSKFFADQPAVYAYDLFNEPWAGLRTLPWAMENPLLRPLFVRAIQTIRANHPAPYIFVEPSSINQLGLPFVMDPLPYARVVYEPHVYPLGIGGSAGYTFGKNVLNWYVKKANDEGARFGAPAFIGETGINSDAANAGDYARDFADLCDQYLLHFTWWGFWRDDSMGLLNADGTDKETFLQYLNRPYPRAVMGRIVSFVFNADTAVFTVTFRNDAGAAPDARIFVPSARHYTNGFTVESSDPAGTWTQTYDAQTQELYVVADPKSATHSITISAKP